MNNSSAITFGGILGNLISAVGGGQTQQQFSQPSGHGPVKVSNLGYHDDFKFCRHFQDKNILITGATGTIGSALVETLLKNCQLFRRSQKFEFYRNEMDFIIGSHIAAHPLKSAHTAHELSQW